MRPPDPLQTLSKDMRPGMRRLYIYMLSEIENDQKWEICADGYEAARLSCAVKVYATTAPAKPDPHDFTHLQQILTSALGAPGAVVTAAARVVLQ